MNISSESLKDGQPIPEEFAMGRADPAAHATFAGNVSPHLAWTDAPAGTKSFAVICVDLDAPTKPDDVNREGRTVPRDLPRADFSHWVLVDIPGSVTSLAAGAHGKGVTVKGKSGPAAPGGTRHGTNDYTGWFKGDPGMEGVYFGYDGPFPPWNDERVHRYRFTVYALDVATCPVDGRFSAAEALEAMKGRVLAEASMTCTYAIYDKAS